MELPEEIKRIRQRSLLTQIDFAKEVKVAFSTVNRWECGKAKPNINAMKSIKEFCLKTCGSNKWRTSTNSNYF